MVYYRMTSWSRPPKGIYTMKVDVSLTAPDDAPPPENQGALRLFSRLAVFVLFYNLVVIALGTVVRATGSGDGCGSHWPLCDGALFPLNPSIQQLIESRHRQVSELDGLLVMALVGGGLYAFRGRPHPIRWALLATLFCTGLEAWIGKYLVNNHLVAHDLSPQRAAWMSVHLTNTFLLVFALTLTAWWARGAAGLSPGGTRLRLRGQGGLGIALALGLASLLVLGVSGAVTALGDTLFPATSHADFVHQAQVGANFLQKLRVYHAPLAGSVGLYIVLIAGLTRYLRPSPETARWARGVMFLFFAQVGVGALNVTLLAPVWVQVIHLIMADLVWVTFSLLAIAAVADGVPQLELQAMNDAVRDFARPSLRDYYQITKPRVVSLLLFTTMAALFIARDATHRVTPLLFLAVLVGGYMSAGAANVFNMVIDRDIDFRMTRTSTRATVTRKISGDNAIKFGLLLMFGSFALLTWASNMLAALLALAGLVYYVIVYTLFLKRKHWQNIVIGGAAGAFPPLVGWAAVQGDVRSWLAWYLFAIIFVWTPAHFWALALLLRDDYAEAGVPMLPVVHGERTTVWHIAAYAILTAVVSVLPVLQHLVGYGYVAAALALDAVLVGMAFNLFKRTDRPHASQLFHYSMIYLALLFLAMAIEKVVVS